MISPKIQTGLLAFMLLGSVAIAEQSISFEKVVRYEETVAGNRIEVVIHQKKFDFSKYKLTGGTGNGDGPARIDGVEIAGTDGNSPARRGGWPVVETIAEIDLKWNGKPVSVPKLLHVNLLQLSLDEGCIQFIPRPSGEELLIQATGGDGGGSYLVSLVLRKNGKHKQYEAGYCESGLRPYPYMIEEFGKADSDGVEVKEFPWLEPRPKSDAATGVK
jgi:hypothetical protein